MAELIPYANLQLKTAIDLNKISTEDALKAEDEVNELKETLQNLTKQLQTYKDKYPEQQNEEAQLNFDNILKCASGGNKLVIPDNINKDRVSERLKENLNKLKTMKQLN